MVHLPQNGIPLVLTHIPIHFSHFRRLGDSKIGAKDVPRLEGEAPLRVVPALAEVHRGELARAQDVALALWRFDPKPRFADSPPGKIK